MRDITNGDVSKLLEVIVEIVQTGTHTFDVSLIISLELLNYLTATHEEQLNERFRPVPDSNANCIG